MDQVLLHSASKGEYPKEYGLAINLRVFQPLNILRELSGNAQITFLKGAQNSILKEILEYTYDTHKKYKLDEKLNKFLPEGVFGDRIFDAKSWEIFKGHLDYLAEKAAANDDEAKKTAEFISRFNKEGQELCKQILNKDLRINMGIKKFQKVWPGMLSEPQVQLANIKTEKDHFKNGFYSRKFDGKRMYIQDNLPYSRANNLCYINPVKHILEQVKELLSNMGDNPNYFNLDGECLYFENGLENFQKGISLCQSEERKLGCDNICYVIFDMIPKTKFINKEEWEKFEYEYDRVINAFADFSKPTPDYSLIPTKMPNIFIARQDKDPSKLMKLCSEKNWEGLMYRDGDACYEYKRTKSLLKIKQFSDTELKVVAMEEGTGRNLGRLGALIVEYKGSTVNVGSGFSDDLRIEYWENKDKYIGLNAKIKYFEETTDQSGKPSLRFPTFLTFRNVDTNEEFLTR